MNQERATARGDVGSLGEKLTDQGVMSMEPPSESTPQQQQRAKYVYIPSDEEKEVMRQCAKESFWYRCVPLVAGSLVTVNYFLRKGQLASHPKFGPWPKYLGASVFAYIAGKFSYWGVCKQKLLQLPNSQLAEIYKRAHMNRRQGGMVGGGGGNEPIEMRGEQAAPPQHSSDHDQRLDSHDTFTPEYQYAELPEHKDDSFIVENDPPTSRSQQTSSYDDLRQKHREKMTKKHQFPAVPARGAAPGQEQQETWEQNRTANDTQETRPSYQRRPVQLATSTGAMKNQYGDVWDK